MVAQLNWPTTLPQRVLARSLRARQLPGMLDRYEAIPPIYFVRSRAKHRTLSGTLRLTWEQRDIFLTLEPSLRGKRFNADFENFGATRETALDSWDLSALENGQGFLLNMNLTVFEVSQLVIDLYPDSGTITLTGVSPPVLL